MKILKITINVPNINNKWCVSFLKDGKSAGSYKKRTAVGVYRLTERKLVKLLASSDSPTIKVSLDYSQLHGGKTNEWMNEGEYSKCSESLYVLSCFLEDFLPYQYSKGKLEKYGNDYLTDRAEK